MDPRAKALSALARFQVTEASVGETLNRIASITLDAMLGAATVGMTMLGEDGRPTTAVYTDEESRRGRSWPTPRRTARPSISASTSTRP